MDGIEKAGGTTDGRPWLTQLASRSPRRLAGVAAPRADRDRSQAGGCGVTPSAPLISTSIVDTAGPAGIPGRGRPAGFERLGGALGGWGGGRAQRADGGARVGPA